MTESFDIPFTGTQPVQAHPGDAGADLVSAISLTLAPGERALVPTGTSVALPDGTVGLVAPRSGLAAKHGITIVNAPGIIDSGYRGELKVCLLNTDHREAYEIAAGDRIAQLLVLPIPQITYRAVTELPSGERGDAGFGSSGYGQRTVTEAE
ncbi:dUTP diphosphatase [Gulosibacter hominis]|uniref:dUTP diphosphatase n=1 Tax=Gulosibacter hominis TaxID=2770504 RepID=UPI00191ACFD0|nr:dUTP diphosphatase [Gulosibacter hominis]